MEKRMKKYSRIPSEKSKELSQKVRDVISKFSQPPEIEWIRTGIHALDLMIGNGIPLGRIIEIFGDESTGKSLLAWEIAKAFQREGGVVVVFDVEATAPKKFMTKVGLDVTQVIYRKPDTIEDLEKEFYIIHDSLRKADPDINILYIHDSVAATSSIGEWDYDKKTKRWIPKEHEMASRARAMSKLMRHITKEISSSNAVYLAVNQVRDKIGVMYGEKTTTPGGRALRFHSSVRLQLNRGGRIEVDGQKPIGVLCKAFVKKNKVGEPFRKAELRILWEKGFEPCGGLADLLEEHGRIKSAGKPGRYKYNNIKFRKKNVELIVKKKPELLEAMT